MIFIRIHGRGGQGAVTGAELLAIAAFKQGKYSQAFPFFGVERQGAPVEAYCRIDDKKITIRSQASQPDFVIIQDPTLLANQQVFAGIKKNTLFLINSEKKPSALDLPTNISAKTIPATKIALKYLGKPIINTSLLGAFAGATKLISIDALKKAITEKFSEKSKEITEKNIAAAQEAYNLVLKN
ncbi:MAG: pyruvate ferredoxin oxidoreductase subunit gamma [Patescibacteria group bacterium]|jgi:pyruvate ferredoxin oxidoreductase gamma subunit